MSHLITSPELRGWSVWRWVALRSAGFPVDLVETLATPELAVAADALGAARARLLTAREALAAAYKATRVELAPAERRPYTEAIRQIWNERVPSLEPVGAPGALEQLRLADATSQSVQTELSRVFASAVQRTRVAITDVARSERFREAVAWQNRTALVQGIDWLLRQPSETDNRRTRSQEHLVASYLQRYCLKNDSIGFFGPIGWAEVVERGEAMAVRSGTSFLSRREVFFEYWAIDTFGSQLAEDPELRFALAPRRSPTMRLDGTTLVQAGRPIASLSPAAAALIASADGIASAAEIVQRLLADPALELASEDDGLELLDELAERRVILWTLEIPPASLRYERTLRDMLTAVRSNARLAALARLDEFAKLRDAIAAAAGNPSLLIEQLGVAEQRFTELTGHESSRKQGETYAGRTLFYEDTRRDVDVRIGPEVLARLGDPLSLVLHAARWFTREVGRAYEQAFGGIYRETGPADFLEFWRACAPLFAGERSAIVERVRAELHRKWKSLLLSGAADPRRVVCSAAALAPRVDEVFAADPIAWPSARFHSPDILIAATDPAELTRGGGYFVLGEVHVALNTLMNPSFVRQHDDPEGLLRAWQIDCGEQVVAVVEPKATVTNADFFSMLPRAVDIEAGDGRSARSRDAVVAIADLRVEEHDSMLCVRSRDGRWRWPLLAALDHHLVSEVSGRFSLLAAEPHTPRITIDELVVQRERWAFAPDALAFAHIEDRTERFTATREWARAQQIPRFAFFKLPEEPKPYFVDFESLSYVDIFTKLARQASSFVVTEMLPTPDECWLRDADGRAYTSELRLVAVDAVDSRGETMPRSR